MRSAPVRWNGAVVVITGGSRGIGRAIARRAVVAGARVGLVARGGDELNKTLEELGGDKAGAVAVADMTNRSEVERALSELEERLGTPEILVNNAGIGAAGAVAGMPTETIERVMAVNYLGAVYATKAVLPAMIEHGRGHIVNIASVAGRFATPYEAAYSASKFALVALSHAMALELRGQGVRVSLVDPGPVDTDFFDARGVPYDRRWPPKVDPDRVARAVISAVDRKRLETFVPWWFRAIGALQAGAPELLHLVPGSAYGRPER